MNDTFAEFLKELARVRADYDWPEQDWSPGDHARFVGSYRCSVDVNGAIDLPAEFRLKSQEKFFVGQADAGQLLVIESTALMMLSRDYPELEKKHLETLGFSKMPHLVWVGDDGYLRIPDDLRFGVGIASTAHVEGHVMMFSFWAPERGPVDDCDEGLS